MAAKSRNFAEFVYTARMQLSYVALLAVAAILPVAAAGAQDDPRDITVRADRSGLPSSTQSVRAISQAVDGGLPRFENPVCPGAVGPPARLAMGIVERMRATISEAGVDLAPEGCGANLTLIVVDDGAALVERLASKSPALFRPLLARDIYLLENDPGPVRSWHTTERRRADGAAEIENMVRNVTMSRLTSPVRIDVKLGFVVIDAAAINGLEVRQIADYAVMRGLAPTRDASSSAIGHDSILELFGEDGQAVAQLTEFDRTYLSALYSGGNGLTYDQKTRQIAGQLDRSERDGR